MLKIFLLSFLLTLNLAFAQVENLSSVIRGQQDVLETVLDEDTVEAFVLKEIRVRTVLELYVEAPGVANLTVKPGIELTWSR